ncbi:MAG: hypothetical protein SFV51_00255 [Bryobacteraceae bacterium]|nr:hypothetical protein [Bryobacteraceae bacterium]
MLSLLALGITSGNPVWGAVSSLAAGSVVASGGSAAVPISFVSGSGNTGALQWNVIVPGASIVSIVAGTAASSSGKTLSCNGGACLLSGLNSAAIPSGVVAIVTVSVSQGGGSSLPVQLYGVLEAMLDASPGAATAVNGGISVPSAPVATPPTVSSLSCGVAAIAPGQVTSCTVSLSKAAPMGGHVVSLTSSRPAAAPVPVNVTIPAFASAAQFPVSIPLDASAGPAVISASSGVSNASATLQVLAAAPAAIQLSSLACTPVTAATGLNGGCTVRLTGSSGPSGLVVALSSSDAVVFLPPAVGVPAGTSTGHFPFYSPAGTALRPVTLTATLDGVSRSVTLAAPGVLSFHLRGNSSEMVGTANGSVVTPAVSPSGLTGRVTARGKGYLTFAGVSGGNGLTFNGEAGNRDTAFINFQGTRVGQVFNAAGGEIQFLLKSKYSFAERMALPQANYRWVFDVFDNRARLFTLGISTSDSRLILTYSTGGTLPLFYYFPAGQEETMFGRNTVLTVRLTWDGSRSQLYLNGTLMQTAPYLRATPEWSEASSFTLGAVDARVSGGGYYALDDAVADFQVK